MRILLIRHGNVELLGRVLYSRMPGIHLSEEGCRQVQTLARALKERYNIAEIVSSPMERAMETAQAIAEMQGGVPLSVEEGINEVDAGSWMGKPFEVLFALDEWKEYNRHRSRVCPPGGEFTMQVQMRAWCSVQRVLERYKSADDATVAMVSHGDVIRALLILVLGMPLDYIHRLEVAPASVSEVHIGSGAPRVLTINHLF